MVKPFVCTFTLLLIITMLNTQFQSSTFAENIDMEELTIEVQPHKALEGLKGTVLENLRTKVGEKNKKPTKSCKQEAIAELVSETVVKNGKDDLKEAVQGSIPEKHSGFMNFIDKITKTESFMGGALGGGLGGAIGGATGPIDGMIVGSFGAGIGGGLGGYNVSNNTEIRGFAAIGGAIGGILGGGLGGALGGAVTNEDNPVVSGSLLGLVGGLAGMVVAGSQGMVTGATTGVVFGAGVPFVISDAYVKSTLVGGVLGAVGGGVGAFLGSRILPILFLM